jgi:hypothetical protein
MNLRLRNYFCTLWVFFRNLQNFQGEVNDTNCFKYLFTCPLHVCGAYHYEQLQIAFDEYESNLNWR